MRFFSRWKKKTSRRSVAYARPRWVDTMPADAGGREGKIHVDFDKLGTHGFVTRDTIEGNLGREFSLIKRRLLRRMDYFNTSKDGEKRAKDERCPVVLVTSSKPGEGKTFSASNLALSLAFEEQIKVLLMDADLAKPSVPGVFGFPDDRTGLYDCLKDPMRKVEGEIQQISGTNLAILPAGQATTSPAPLLGSGAMLRILDEVSSGDNAFDLVVMDGPPLLATTEASVLADYADETLLVIGAGDSTISQIKSSIDLLGEQEKIILMINHMPLGEALPTEYGYLSHR